MISNLSNTDLASANAPRSRYSPVPGYSPGYFSRQVSRVSHTSGHRFGALPARQETSPAAHRSDAAELIQNQQDRASPHTMPVGPLLPQAIPPRRVRETCLAYVRRLKRIFPDLTAKQAAAITGAQISNILQMPVFMSMSEAACAAKAAITPRAHQETALNYVRRLKAHTPDLSVRDAALAAGVNTSTVRKMPEFASQTRSAVQKKMLPSRPDSCRRPDRVETIAPPPSPIEGIVDYTLAYRQQDPDAIRRPHSPDASGKHREDHLYRTASAGLPGEHTHRLSTVQSHPMTTTQTIPERDARESSWSYARRLKRQIPTLTVSQAKLLTGVHASNLQRMSEFRSPPATSQDDAGDGATVTGARARYAPNPASFMTPLDDHGFLSGSETPSSYRQTSDTYSAASTPPAAHTSDTQTMSTIRQLQSLPIPSEDRRSVPMSTGFDMLCSPGVVHHLPATLIFSPGSADLEMQPLRSTVSDTMPAGLDAHSRNTEAGIPLDADNVRSMVAAIPVMAAFMDDPKQHLAGTSAQAQPLRQEATRSPGPDVAAANSNPFADKFRASLGQYLSDLPGKLMRAAATQVSGYSGNADSTANADTPFHQKLRDRILQVTTSMPTSSVAQVQASVVTHILNLIESEIAYSEQKSDAFSGSDPLSGILQRERSYRLNSYTRSLRKIADELDGLLWGSDAVNASLHDQQEPVEPPSPPLVTPTPPTMHSEWEMASVIQAQQEFDPRPGTLAQETVTILSRRPSDHHIELQLQHHGVSANISWPVGQIASCASLLLDWLQRPAPAKPDSGA